MIGRLNHVAIAVPDLDQAADLYRTTLGAKVSAPSAQPRHVASASSSWSSAIPRSSYCTHWAKTSPIAAFLGRNPAGGIHHICYEVDDILAGPRPAEGKRRPGAGRRRTQDRRP